VGFDKSVMQSEPDRRAAQPQRVQQQVQIQIAIHGETITAGSQRVKSFFFFSNRGFSPFHSAFTFKVELNSVLPLSQAADAHRLQEESTVRKTGALAGKIVLKP